MSVEKSFVRGSGSVSLRPPAHLYRRWARCLVYSQSSADDVEEGAPFTREGLGRLADPDLRTREWLSDDGGGSTTCFSKAWGALVAQGRWCSDQHAKHTTTYIHNIRGYVLKLRVWLTPSSGSCNPSLHVDPQVAASCFAPKGSEVRASEVFIACSRNPEQQRTEARGEIS